MAFTKITLADIRNSVGRRLDDNTFDIATIDECANDFQFELFNDNRIRFMEKSGSLSVSEGDTSVALPSDFMNATGLISNGVNIIDTGYLDYNTFMKNHPNFATASPQPVTTWTIIGETIRFSAPADDDYTLTLDYIKSPTIMVNATDTSELPINCRELITLGTLERIQRINEDYNQSDFENMRLRELRNAFTKNYARGWERSKPLILKTGRNKVWNTARDF